MDIYYPREDSKLICEQVKNFAKGNVLDVGTGTGVLAIEASSSKDVDQVIGIDINPKAIKFAKARGNDKTKFLCSDLFSAFKGKDIKFDLITFNPPYLPYDKDEPEDIRKYTTGGKKGYELIERFFSEVSGHLMPYGKILIVFSTLTGKEKVHEIMADHGFNFQKVAEESFFYETIFVYEAEKSDDLRKIEAKGVSGLKKFTKGHRGVIFTGKLKKKKVAVKVKNPLSKANGNLVNEARWLKVLNLRDIGPKLRFYEENILCYDYVEGDFFPKILEEAGKGIIKKVVKDVFEQCHIMDKINVNKEEMHNPYKHIIVKKDLSVVMLDFERAHYSDKPKNVTQFSQYMISKKVEIMIKDKGFSIDKKKVRKLSREYKKSLDKSDLRKIIKAIK